MSQSEYNDDVVTWSIDIRPDYNLNNIIEDSTDYVEATDYLVDYDYIPFDNLQNPNNVNNTCVNFIISEFYLSKEAKNCCICMEHKNYKQICKLNCRHNFCVGCINLHLNTNHYCPLCRAYIYQIQTQTIEARRQIHH